MKTRSIALKVIAVSIPGVLLLGACGQDEPTSPSAQPSVQASDLTGRTFAATDVTVEDDGTPPPNGGADMTLTFTDTGISATGGCNTMNGDATISDGTLMVSNGLAMTEMGCETPRMDQDTWFADLLTSEPALSLDDNVLTLTSSATVVTMTDTQSGAPQADLVGPTWALDSLAVGQTASSVPQGVESTLEFTDDGTVSVRFGCNSGSGTYTVDGETISFGPISSTLMGCTGSAQDVETSVSQVLKKDVDFAIEGQLLSLTNGDESLVYRVP